MFLKTEIQAFADIIVRIALNFTLCSISQSSYFIEYIPIKCTSNLLHRAILLSLPNIFRHIFLHYYLEFCFSLLHCQIFRKRGTIQKSCDVSIKKINVILILSNIRIQRYVKIIKAYSIKKNKRKLHIKIII